MIVTKPRARLLAVLAILGVIALQGFNSFFCYQHDLAGFAMALAWFIAIPLVPAFVSLATANPLRAVGACVLFAPWLLLAYYTDCVQPYQGGGASMIYVAVLLWGSLSSLAGALLAGPLMRLLGIRVA